VRQLLDDLETLKGWHAITVREFLRKRIKVDGWTNTKGAFQASSAMEAKPLKTIDAISDSSGARLHHGPIKPISAFSNTDHQNISAKPRDEGTTNAHRNRDSDDLRA